MNSSQTMDLRKIYLRGECCGIYGAGMIVYARRNDEPGVIKGNYYTIEDVVVTELGACARNQGIVLEGVDGVYYKNTFKVNQECLQRMEDLE